MAYRSAGTQSAHNQSLAGAVRTRMIGGVQGLSETGNNCLSLARFCL